MIPSTQNLNTMSNCPICQNEKTKIKYNLKFKVYQCENCGFQFCPEASFNKSFRSDFDESIRLKALKNLRILNFKRIISSLKKYPTGQSKGLEVGVGHGWFLETCANQEIQCEGIEPETRFNDEYERMNLWVRNGFYPDVVPLGSTYNFIVFNDVFEHLPKVEVMMKENSILLNSNGLLVINLPIQEGLTYTFSKIAYCFGIKSLLNRMWQFNFHSPHLSYFNKKNLQELAEKNGFELQESFPLKTINLSEVRDRINQDKTTNFLFRYVTIIGVYILYPFLNWYPDTYCFIFRKK